MSRHSLQQCVADLEGAGQLIRFSDPVSPILELAEIQRRVYRSGGPAVLFENVTGCQFPMLGNLFGTLDRARFVFRRTLDQVRRLIELKTDPQQFFKHPSRYLRAFPTALAMRPRRRARGPVFAREIQSAICRNSSRGRTTAGRSLRCRRFTRKTPTGRVFSTSNLGMYRVQLSGGQYEADQAVGLHYQIHRGIGVHHAAAIGRGEPLPVNIFVGGLSRDDTGRGDAVARRNVRTDVCRRAGRSSHTDGQSARANCRSTPTPTSASPARSRPTSCCPRGRSAITWDTTV